MTDTISTCKKVKYESKSDAKKASKLIEKRARSYGEHPERQYPYMCEECHVWHLSRSQNVAKQHFGRTLRKKQKQLRRNGEIDKLPDLPENYYEIRYINKKIKK